jgi:hypothetical protein
VKAIVEIAADEGAAPIRIEVAGFETSAQGGFYADEETRGFLSAATQPIAKTARQLYADAVDVAISCATQTSQHLAAMDKKSRPDEFEVQFALSVDLGIAKIVDIGSGAQVQVRMQWNRGTDE